MTSEEYFYSLGEIVSNNIAKWEEIISEIEDEQLFNSLTAAYARHNNRQYKKNREAYGK